MLATYQGEKFIKEQLESIRSQSNTNWITYIHDDGSEDNTLAVVKEYEKNNPEQFVIIKGEPTGGAKNNFLYLMSQVEAPYYMCCDQDDVWLQNKIEDTFKVMKRMESETDELCPCLVFTDLKVVDSKLITIAERMSQFQNLDCKNIKIGRILLQNVVTGCTMMFNRELCRRMLQYNDIDHIIMHDWWGALIAAQFGKIQYIDKPTILYRQHGDNNVGAFNTHSFKYFWNKLKKIKRIKKTIDATRVQAREMVDVFHLAQDSLVGKFAYSESLSKWKRIRLYRNNELLKTGFFRNISLFLFG